jgi:hypothetical protein
MLVINLDLPFKFQRRRTVIAACRCECASPILASCWSTKESPKIPNFNQRSSVFPA